MVLCRKKVFVALKESFQALLGCVFARQQRLFQVRAKLSEQTNPKRHGSENRIPAAIGAGTGRGISLELRAVQPAYRPCPAFLNRHD